MARVGVPAGREMVFDRGVSVQFARPITVRFIRELRAQALVHHWPGVS